MARRTFCVLRNVVHTNAVQTTNNELLGLNMTPKTSMMADDEQMIGFIAMSRLDFDKFDYVY